MRVRPLPVLLTLLLLASGCVSVPRAASTTVLGPGGRLQLDLPVGAGGSLHLVNRGPAPVDAVVRLRGGRVLAAATLGELHVPDLERIAGGGELVLVLEAPGPGRAAVEIALDGEAAEGWSMPGVP